MPEITPRRGSDPAPPAPSATMPRPRRSATSPSSWDEWNEGDDLAVVPSHSARLVDSVPPPLPAMPRRDATAPQVASMGRRALPTVVDSARGAMPRRSATSPSQWMAWDDEEDMPVVHRRSTSVPGAEPKPRPAQPVTETREQPWWFWPLLVIILIALITSGIIMGLEMGRGM